MIALCYHRIVGKRSIPTLGSTFDIPLSTFKKHLSYFTENFELPSLTERFDLGAFIRKKKRKPILLLTFDDGYQEMGNLVLPMLLRHRLRAVFFLATAVLEEAPLLWYQKIEQAFLKTGRKAFLYQGKRFSLRSREDKRSAFSYFLNAVARRGEKTLKSEVETIFKILEVPEEELKAPLSMTWSETKKLQKNGMILGFHSHRHFNLPSLSRESLQRDFDRGLSLMNRRLGISPSLFAYPFGTEVDFNEGVKVELKKRGFHHAFTTLWGEAPPETERFSLPRLAVEPRHSLKDLAGFIRLIQLGFFENVRSAGLNLRYLEAKAD